MPAPYDIICIKVYELFIYHAVLHEDFSPDSRLLCNLIFLKIKKKSGIVKI